MSTVYQACSNTSCWCYQAPTSERREADTHLALPLYEGMRPVASMSDRELLEESVVNTREILAFARDVAKGMEEFTEKFKNNPLARFFGG